MTTAATTTRLNIYRTASLRTACRLLRRGLRGEGLLAGHEPRENGFKLCDSELPHQSLEWAIRRNGVHRTLKFGETGVRSLPLQRKERRDGLLALFLRERQLGQELQPEVASMRDGCLQ